MSMHLEKFEKLATRVMFSQIIEDYDKLEPQDLRKKIVDVLKNLQSESYFLISYDFKNNNSILKDKLLNSTPQNFFDSVGQKTFPNSTLIWKGPTNATVVDAFNNFAKRVKEIIRSNDLDSDLSKTIIIEILDPQIIIDER